MSKFLDNLIRQKQAEIQRLVEINNKTGKGEGRGIAGSASRRVNQCADLRKFVMNLRLN